MKTLHNLFWRAILLINENEMEKVVNIREAIKTSSCYKSSELDLEKTSDELWTALLSCKKFLSTVSFLPKRQYFIKNEDENFWEYFVPKANSPFKPINQKICYVIEIQSGSNLEGEGFFGLEDKKYKTVLAFHVDDIIQLNLNSKIEKIFDLENELRRPATSICLYLPIILGEWRARQNSSVFVTGHLTQSEDGKIAKKDGTPVWLGGEMDKKHTHRLRSLHESLLIGSKTFRNDNPKLTVRHCKGKNPIPIIFKDSHTSFFNKDLFKVKNREVFLLCRDQKQQSNYENLQCRINELNFNVNKAVFSPKEILTKLEQKGIHSVFIEGGGITISHFLTSNLLDRFHLQITNRKIGSGVNSFTLPTSSSIEEIHSLNRIDYKIKDQTLIDYSPVSS